MSIVRCPWVPLDNELYVNYHDNEWGVPLHDDNLLFELLVLESAQAGLSWLTVLKKREEYRRVFNGFDPQKIAKYSNAFVASCLLNPGLIRNRAKIESAILNARVFCTIQDEFRRFDRYIWQFVGNKPLIHSFKTMSDYPTTSPESDALSIDLKKRGMKFVGSTICYAFMQSAGLVHDHTVDCFRYACGR